MTFSGTTSRPQEPAIPKTTAIDPDAALTGLSSAEARERLKQVGPNSMAETKYHPLRRIIDKLWAPVPWMLEAAILLQLVLHKFTEAAVIASLLLFNAALGFFQEGKAQATLAALKSRLALNASVRRDGVWTIVPAAELVPGDTVKLSLGAVVAADVRIIDGSVLLDQSMLTGESVPVESGAGTESYAGALVRRGEATAIVTQTGVRTKFGRTAELVRSAHVVSSQQKAVLRVVRNLALFNGVVIVALVIYATLHGMQWNETIPLILTAVLAAIPVALPATFTLATALSARSLAKRGVLPTRLSAIDEAASMDVLCSDKTGTLTRNELSVNNVRTMSGHDEAYVLGLATLASAEGGQDPVDAAIRAAAKSRPESKLPKLVNFIPFDPAKKMSEAHAIDRDGVPLRVVKGAYSTIAALTHATSDAETAVDELEKQGYRVLAVAAGAEGAMQLAGLIALSDPPRSDSAALIAELKTLGVRTIMVTGDAPATAGSVARAVGLNGPVCPPGPLPEKLRPEDFAVFAGIFPEGKFDLVKAFQRTGHTVGMCGDGANDAPALRQAQIGVAVSTATDVAKSAAGIVLTTAGLDGIVAAVKEGRSAFQRILTYTLNSVTKKIVNVIFLAIGLIITGHAVLTPMLMVIIMITGDFLGMSVTADNVRQSAAPNKWQIGKLTIAGSVLGSCLLAFATGALLIGAYWLRMDIRALQTFAMVALVFGSEATLYSIRERDRMWRSRPGIWMVIASIGDILIISILAIRGIAIQSLPIALVGGTLLAALFFAFLLDLVKVPLFRLLQIA
ncbi:plasma-membrane proton-efflux P-type ATPase [Acidipila rosea]|uniref:H+-transporting ATPase n=1 Tax=Acidipila rosea TaxID=768535 RepID=A0A4R1LDM8_9BACT|nr:plasma-membrane proton-efflux P-type ATPase [Acidipila rosea]TCK75837.1 H+-transporting ATPase [Acidipila rosea]